MKKKFRNIVVGDVEYAWSVVEKRWPHLTLKIWLKKRGKVPWCEVSALATSHVITPRHVQNIILNVLAEAKNENRLKEKNYTFQCNIENICTNTKLSE